MGQIFWQRHNKGNDVEALAKMYLTEGNTSELNAGGKMNPEQQLGAMQAVRAQSTLLAPHMPTAVAPGGPFLPAVANPNPMVPNVGVPGLSGAPVGMSGPGIDFIASSTGRTSGTVESFLATGYVVKGATQATQNAGPARSILRPRALEWAYKKYHVLQEWSKEETWQTLLMDRWDEFLMSRLVPIIAGNLELAFLHGDESIIPAAGDDEAELLSVNDGWLKQMKALSPQIDYQGSFIDDALWYAMIRQFPSMFQPRRKYWFCNPAMPIDWLQILQARGAGAIEASAALGGASVAPLGIQFWTVPVLKIDEAITTVAAATNAYVRGVAQDQFAFPPDAYQFTINVNGQGAVTVVFPHTGNASKQLRSHSAYAVCKRINDALVDEYGDNTYRHVARVGQRGQIELITPNTGAARSIVLSAPVSSCLGVLGFTAGTTNGQDAAAGATNTTYNGTSLFLTLPENLQWRTSTAPMGTGEGGFSQHLKYRQENDSFRYDAYAHHDVTLGLPEACVLAYGLKVARSGENPAA